MFISYYYYYYLLLLPPSFEVGMLKAIKHLRPSKSVELADIPGFIVKGSSTIFAPQLKYIIGW
jgi:hypothetical protein